jgi:hypothetical protein
MVRVTITTNTVPPDEFRELWPNLATRNHADSTTLTGELLDIHELQVVLKTLDNLGVEVALVRSMAAL